MLKKIILIIGLNVFNLQAVILRNGSSVPYKIASKTWQAIQKLQTERKCPRDNYLCLNYRYLLACAESEHHNLEIIGDKYFSKSDKDIQKKQQCLQEAQSLGFINSKNIMNQDVAEVIKSSIFFDGVKVWSIKSPFAWSNWLNLNYWQRKD